MDVTVWVDVPEGARATVSRQSLQDLATLARDMRGPDTNLARIAGSERARIGPKEDFRDRASLRAAPLLEELDAMTEALGIPDLLETTLVRVLERHPLREDDDPYLVRNLRPDWVALRDAVIFARRTGHSVWVEGPLGDGEQMVFRGGPPRFPLETHDVSALRLPWDPLLAGLKHIDFASAAAMIEEAWLWGRWLQRTFEQWRRDESRNDLDAVRASDEVVVLELGQYHSFSSAWTWSVRPGGAHWASTFGDGRIAKDKLGKLVMAILATLEGGFGLVQEDGAVHLVLRRGPNTPAPECEDIQGVLAELERDGAHLTLTNLQAFIEQAGGKAEVSATARTVAVSHRTGNLDVTLTADGRIQSVIGRS